MWYSNLENGKTTEEKFMAWRLAHTCDINTERSSPGMESEVATILWNRSCAERSLQYTTFIGDGDSKSYRAVCDAKPYPGVDIQKEEYIVHIQKRLGTGLRELKRTMKGKKLSDGKTIGGASRLTDKLIDTLQTYYGMAIRAHHQYLQVMAKAIKVLSEMLCSYGEFTAIALEREDLVRIRSDKKSTEGEKESRKRRRRRRKGWEKQAVEAEVVTYQAGAFDHMRSCKSFSTCYNTAGNAQIGVHFSLFLAPFRKGAQLFCLRLSL